MPVLLVQCDNCGRVFEDAKEEYGADEFGVKCQICMNNEGHVTTQREKSVRAIAAKVVNRALKTKAEIRANREVN